MFETNSRSHSFNEGQITQSSFYNRSKNKAFQSLDLHKIERQIETDELNLHSQIPLLKGSINLHDKSYKECLSQVDQMEQKQKIYIKALNTFTFQINHASTQSFLQNISLKLSETSQSFHQSLSDLINNKEKRIRDLESTLSQLREEYDKYRNENDLNQWLVRGVDPTAARQLIKMIKEIDSETDWHRDYLSHDTINQRQGQGQKLENELQQIIESYLNRPIKQIMQEPVSVNDLNTQINQTTGEDEPISFYDFAIEFRKSNDAQLDKTIQLSQKCAVNRLKSLYKCLKNQPSQTLSMSELFTQQQSEIKQLKQDLIQQETSLIKEQNISVQLKGEISKLQNQIDRLNMNKITDKKNFDSVVFESKVVQDQYKDSKQKILEANYSKQKLQDELTVTKSLQDQTNQMKKKLTIKCKRLFKHNYILEDKICELGGKEALEECQLSEIEDDLSPSSIQKSQRLKSTRREQSFKIKQDENKPNPQKQPTVGELQSLVEANQEINQSSFIDSKTKIEPQRRKRQPIIESESEEKESISPQIQKPKSVPKEQPKKQPDLVLFSQSSIELQSPVPAAPLKVQIKSHLPQKQNQQSQARQSPVTTEFSAENVSPESVKKPIYNNDLDAVKPFNITPEIKNKAKQEVKPKEASKIMPEKSVKFIETNEKVQTNKYQQKEETVVNRDLQMVQPQQNAVKVPVKQPKIVKKVQEIHHPKPFTFTQGAQTDIEPFVQLACELLMHQLTLTKVDKPTFRKLSEAVQQIRQKIKMQGTTLKQLIGVQSYLQSSDFTDLHQNSLSTIFSKHFV